MHVTDYILFFYKFRNIISPANKQNRKSFRDMGILDVPFEVFETFQETIPITKDGAIKCFHYLI